MNLSIILKKAVPLAIVAMLAGNITTGFGQEAPTNTPREPFHNQLFYNRFLINPTFSLVRENKSYLNVLLRNESAAFQDNRQNYFLGFSNKLDANTALGLGVYGQWSGVMQEFGFHANYATAVKLGEKSALSFGANVNYRSQGLDKNRIVINQEDPTLDEIEKINTVSVEPGFNLSLGRWDVGMFFSNLVRYDQTNDMLETNFGLEHLRPQLQYTHTLENASGIFENARLMPMIQAGQDVNNEWSLTGSFLLDLPKMGWLQASYDERYGLSSGLGFNLNQRLSLGYLMEKSLTDEGVNLGWNHELSLAYSMNDELRDTGINVQLAEKDTDARIDEIVSNYEQQLHDLKNQVTMSTVSYDEGSMAYQNRMLIDELILRQDSLEAVRNKLFEQRFEHMVRLLRNEVKGSDTETTPQSGHKYNSVPTALASTTTVKKQKNREERFKEFNAIPIRSKNRSEAIGVNSGFYLIANVFKSKSNARSFVGDLTAKGLEARQFYNKENGLHYVYLADFNTKDDADIAIVSNLDGMYQEDKWIMQVYDGMQTAQVSYDME